MTPTRPQARLRVPNAAIAPRPHDATFPAPIELPTTGHGTGAWDDVVERVVVRWRRRYFTGSWEDWHAFVTARRRAPRLDARASLRSLASTEPAAVGVRRRGGRWLESGEAFVRYDAPPGVLVKDLDAAQPDWAREADEIRRRMLRHPHLAEERRKAEMRSRKFSVGWEEVGVVYLMQRITGGPLKLGFALHLERRRRKLSYQYGETLVVLDQAPGTLGDEHRLQNSLWRYRLPYDDAIGVEWFRDVRPVRRALDRLRRHGPGRVPRPRTCPSDYGVCAHLGEDAPEGRRGSDQGFDGALRIH